jgi:hypothetical protein
MMRSLAVSVFVIGACVALAAQTPGSASGIYDPAAEVTYGGIITTVVPANGADGTVGVHVNLLVARGVSVKVHLGPAMFIGMNDGSFLAEDQVLVKGALVTHDGEVALWARTITKNGKTLVLRSADGTPRWPYATADDPDGCGVSHEAIRY